MPDPAPASDVESTPLLDTHAEAQAEPGPASLEQRVKTALQHPGQLNGLEKLLALAGVFLFLVAATGFGLFAGTAFKLGNEHKHGRPQPGGAPTTTVGWTTTVSAPGPTQTVSPPKGPKHAVSWIFLVGCKRRSWASAGGTRGVLTLG